MNRRTLPRTVVLLALVLAVTAVTAACGGSSSTSSSSTQAAAGASTTMASGSVTTSSSAGGSTSDFCTVMSSWKSKSAAQRAAMLNSSTSASALKALFAQLGQVYQQAIAVAPSEIKSSMQVLYSNYLKINQALAAQNYDVQKASQAMMQVAQVANSAEFQNAAQKIQTWAKTNSCHL